MNKLNKLLCGIVITICANSHASELILRNVSLVDVVSLQIYSERTLVIVGNEIVKISDNTYQSQIEDSISIDMTGKYVIPGLIDAHVHHATDPDSWDNYAVTKQRLQHLLRGGVTSVRDMGGDARALANLKRLAEIDQIQSPDIFFSVIIGGEAFFADPRTVSSAKGRVPGETPWMRAVDLDSDFDSVILQAKGIGATGIKVYNGVPSEVLPPLYQSTKKHGLKIWSHATISPASPMDSVVAGVNVLSHVPDLAGEVIDNMRDWRIGEFEISDALFQSSLQQSSYTELLTAMHEKHVVLDATMTVFESRKNDNPLRRKVYEQAKFILSLAVESGVKVGAGTDAFADLEVDLLPPLHEELELLVDEGGMSPLQAIQSASIINAQAIGIEDTHGSVEAGKVANLVFLSEDPSVNISHSKSIVHVMKNGKFMYRGNMPNLPFVSAREVDGMLWMSGQLGNFPTTMTLAGDSIEAQMHQTLSNIGDVLREYDLGYNDVVKCTLMLADINEWSRANEVYKQYFTDQLPTRSAFGASGLALNAKVEVECIAER